VFVQENCHAMTRAQYFTQLAQQLAALRSAGTYKELRHLASPMDARVEMEGYGRVLVLSSNNYLGLANHPDVIAAGQRALTQYGAGTASVRFICGTFAIHRELEQTLARFLHMDAALSYVSCWNANEGVIPLVVGDNGVVISDALNHASIIDGCRLIAKTARKCVYQHSDMADLEARLKEHQDAPVRLVITDGVFSMEGDVCRLPEIVALARTYEALVMVDDSHATGVLGAGGRGTTEHFNMLGQVDIITSTLGKALGGAAGGFVAARKEIIAWCVQKSRPQLFSNALPPTVAASAREAVRVLEHEPERVARLHEKTRYFRARLVDAGFKPLEGASAIIPIIVGETATAIRISNMLLRHGVFVTGFGFPVVPEGKARVRVQISDALIQADLDAALAIFVTVGKEAGLLS
jgi:glycine C-acetyltransferase